MTRCLSLLCLFLAVPTWAQPDPAPPQMLPDAELAAVTFLDPDRGWAVGDRGVIWHTDDGGRTWQLQNSTVACRLEAVQFLDANNGWIVGGWTQPYTHATHGVVLRTRDGGQTWQQIPNHTLPGLRHLRMFDARVGAALGEGSPLYPSGVFRTDDGGRSWSPVPKGETLGWATGDFRDPQHGAVAGLSGELGVIANIEIRPARAPALGLRSVQRMSLGRDGTGWLVGDGGLVLATVDGGTTWNAPAAALPAGTGQLDFRALAAWGQHVWIAGAPGTCVLHSPDGGRSWHMLQTDQTAPLSGLHFIDEFRGWAVGALGTILHTRDGGQTWRRQHGGGTRAALLAIFSEPSRLPLELIVQQSGSEGYLSAVEILGRPELLIGGQRPDDVTHRLRTHAAVAATGGSQGEVAWRFPLPPAGLPQSTESILAGWDRANDCRATALLEEHLVRRIRQWRPEVIVTEDVSPRGNDPLAHMTNQVTLAAVQKAADLAAYSEQLTLGLAPWKVQKVLTVLAEDRQGVINITPAQWTPRLGRSLAEQAEIGRGLLLTDVVGAPRNVGLSLLVDHLPQATGRRDVFSGIVLAPGGEARRELVSPPPGDLAQLSRLAQKRHNVEQLLARADGSGGQQIGRLLQVTTLMEGMPERHQGEILWQAGQRFHRAGHSEQAAEALQMLVEQHPRHSLADAAARWLVQYYASAEVAYRLRKGSKFGVQLATFESSSPTAASAGAAVLTPAAATLAGTAQAGALTPVAAPAHRSGRAIAHARQIEQTRPTLYADPAIRFPLAAALRHAAQTQVRGPGQGAPAIGRHAEQLLDHLTHRGGNSAWSQTAQTEQWLAQPTGNPPKRLLAVVTALSKPKLDGRLDDPLWQVAKPVSLHGSGAAGQLPATVVLAFDDEFLYLACSCRKAPGVDYAADDQPRTPDTDLATRDHLTLWLDTDRDYATSWQIALDHRGWPAESCWGDATWNPQWFIAAAGDNEWWTLEAAIPLAELALKKPAIRDVWAVGIARGIPRVGVQSFTTPATLEPRPETFGLLVFE